jgi:hypothetical protein
LHTYRQAVEQEALISKAPSEQDHNARARMLRNGMAVAGYALLEDFLRSRTAEILERIGDGTTRFRELPREIRVAATEGVFEAVRFQQRFLNRQAEDYFRHYQDHAHLVASTANSAYRISPFAFAHQQSNLASRDVEDILRSFKVDNPWSAVVGIAKRCGVGVFALKDAFEGATARRHAAAHRADADIEHSDLADFDVEALGLAVGFDLLMSRALRYLLDADKTYLSNKGLVAGKHISIRFLRYDGMKWWREVVDNNNRASNRHQDFHTLKVDAIGRARASGQAVVVQDERGLPASWHTPDTD